MPQGCSSCILLWWVVSVALCIVHIPTIVAGVPQCTSGFTPMSVSHQTVVVEDCEGHIIIGDASDGGTITNATIYFRNVLKFTLTITGAVAYTQIYVENCTGSPFRSGMENSTVNHTSMYVVRSSISRGFVLDGNVTARDFNFSYTDSVVEGDSLNESPRLLYYGKITMVGSSVFLSNLFVNCSSFLKSMSLHSLSEYADVEGMEMIIKNATVHTRTPVAFVFAVLTATLKTSRLHFEDVSIKFEPLPSALGDTKTFRGMLGFNDTTIDGVDISMLRTHVQAADTIVALAHGVFKRTQVYLDQATLGLRSPSPSCITLQMADLQGVAFHFANYNLTVDARSTQRGAHTYLSDVRASNLIMASRDFHVTGNGTAATVLLGILNSALMTSSSSSLKDDSSGDTGSGNCSIVFADGAFEPQQSDAHSALLFASVLTGCLVRFDTINMNAFNASFAVLVSQSTWAAGTHLALHRMGLHDVSNGIMITNSTLQGGSWMTLSNVTWRLTSSHVVFVDTVLDRFSMHLDAVDLTLDIEEDIGDVLAQNILVLYRTSTRHTLFDVVASSWLVTSNVVTKGAPAHVGIGASALQDTSLCWRNATVAVDLVRTSVSATGMLNVGERTTWERGTFELLGCDVELRAKRFVILASLESSDVTDVAFVIHKRTRVQIEAINVTQVGGLAVPVAAVFLATSLEHQYRWNTLETVSFILDDSIVVLSSEEKHIGDVSGTMSAFLIFNQTTLHRSLIELRRSEFHGQHSVVMTIPQGNWTQTLANTTVVVWDNSNVTLVGHGPMVALFALLSTRIDVHTTFVVDRSNVTVVVLKSATANTQGSVCAFISVGPASEGPSVSPVHANVVLSNQSTFLATNRNDTNTNAIKPTDQIFFGSHSQVAMVVAFGSKGAGAQIVSGISVVASGGCVVELLDGDMVGLLIGQAMHAMGINIVLSTTVMTLQPKGTTVFLASLLLLNGTTTEHAAVTVVQSAIDMRIQFVNESTNGGPLQPANVAMALYFGSASQCGTLHLVFRQNCRLTMDHTAVVFPPSDAGTALLAFVGLNGGSVADTSVVLESGSMVQIACLECMAIVFAQSNVRSDFDSASLALSNATLKLSASRKNSSDPVHGVAYVLDNPNSIMNVGGIMYQGLGLTRRVVVALRLGSALLLAADLSILIIAASSLAHAVATVHLQDASTINVRSEGTVILLGAMRGASVQNSTFTVTGRSVIDMNVSGPYAALAAVAMFNTVNVNNLTLHVSGSGSVSLFVVRASLDGSPTPLPARDEDTPLASGFFFDKCNVTNVQVVLCESSNVSISGGDAPVALVLTKLAIITGLRISASNHSRMTFAGSTTGPGVDLLNFDEDGGSNMLTKVIGLASFMFSTASTFLGFVLALDTGAVAALSSPMATALLLHRSVVQGADAAVLLSGGSRMRIEAATNTSPLACCVVLATNCTMDVFRLALDGSSSNTEGGGTAATESVTGLEIMLLPVNLTAPNFDVGFVFIETIVVQRVDLRVTNGAVISMFGGSSMVALLMARDAFLGSMVVDVDRNASLTCAATAIIDSKDGGEGGAFSDGFSLSTTSGLVALLVAIRSTVLGSRISFGEHTTVSFESPMVAFMTLQTVVLRDTVILLSGGASVRLVSTARNSTSLLACFVLALSSMALETMSLGVASKAHLVVEVRPQPLERNHTANASSFVTAPSTSYFTVGIMARDSQLSFVDVLLSDGGRLTAASREGTVVWLLAQQCNASHVALRVASGAHMALETMFSGRGVNLLNGFDGIRVDAIGGLCSLQTGENSTVRNSSITVSTHGAVVLACPLAAASIFSKSTTTEYRITIATNGTMNITAHNNSMSLMSVVVLAFSTTMACAAVDVVGGGVLVVAIVAPTPTSTTSTTGASTTVIYSNGSYFSAALLFVEATLDGLSMTLTDAAQFSMVGLDAMIAIIIAQRSNVSSVAILLDTASEIFLRSTSATAPLGIVGLQNISVSSMAGMAAVCFASDAPTIDALSLTVEGASRIILDAPVSTIALVACTSASSTTCAVDGIRLLVVGAGSAMQLNAPSAGAFLLASNVSATSISVAVRDGGNVLIAGQTGSVVTLVVAMRANITGLNVSIAERASVHLYGLARGTTCALAFSIGLCRFAGISVAVSMHASVELLSVPLSNVSVVALSASSNGDGISDALTNLLGAAAVLLLFSEGTTAANASILVDSHSSLLVRGAVSAMLTCQKCGLDGFRLTAASGAVLQLPTLGVSIAFMIAEPMSSTDRIAVSFQDASFSQSLPLSGGDANYMLAFLFVSIVQTLHTLESLSISLVRSNLTIACLRCQMAVAVLSGGNLRVSNATLHVTDASRIQLQCTLPLLSAPLMQLLPLLADGGDVSVLLGPAFPDKGVGGLLLIVAEARVDGLDVQISGEHTLVLVDAALAAAVLAINGAVTRSTFAVRDHGSVVIQGGRGYQLTFTTVSTGGIVAFLFCMSAAAVDQFVLDVNRGTVTTRLEQGFSASLLLLNEAVLGSSSSGNVAGGSSAAEYDAITLSLTNQSVATAIQLSTISIFGNSVSTALHLLLVSACTTSTSLSLTGVRVNVSTNSTVAMYIPSGSAGVVGYVYVWNTPRLHVYVHTDATSALALPTASDVAPSSPTSSSFQFAVRVSTTNSIRLSIELSGSIALLPSVAAVWVSGSVIDAGSDIAVQLALPTTSSGGADDWAGEILRLDGTTSMSNATIALRNMTLVSPNAKLMSSPVDSVDLGHVNVTVTDCTVVVGSGSGGAPIAIGTLRHCVVALTRNAFYYASMTSSAMQGLSDPRGPILLSGPVSSSSNHSQVTLVLDDNAFHRFATVVDAASVLVYPDVVESHCTTFLRDRAWIKRTMTPGSRAVVLPIMRQYNTALWNGALCEWSMSVTASETDSAATPSAVHTHTQSASASQTLTLTQSIGSATPTRSRRPTPSMGTATGTEERTTTETIIPPTPTISLYVAQRPCPQITAVLAAPSQITDAMFATGRLRMNLTLPTGYRWWNRPWAYNAETFFRFEVIADTQPQPQGFDRYMKDSALLNQTEWRFSGSHGYDTITVTFPQASQYRLLLSEDVAIEFDPRAIQFQCVGDVKARAVFQVTPAESTALVDAARYSAAGAALAALGSIGVSAADNQLLLILAGTKCSTAVLGGTTGYSMYLLSPFFDYGFEAMIYGNIGIVFAVATLQNVLAALFYGVVLRKKVGKPPERTNDEGVLVEDPSGRPTTSTDYVFVAWSQVQFPGLTYAVGILLQQGTFLAAVRIAFRGEGGPNAAVAVLLAVIYTFAFIRAFLRFLDTPKRMLESGELIPMENRNHAPVFKVYEAFKALPLVWKLLNPVGRWGPREQVRMFGKYFGQMQPAYFHLGPYPSMMVVLSTLFAVIPFSGTGCIVQFVLIGLVPMVAGLFVLYRRPHRIPMVSVIGGCLHLIAGVIAMITAYLSSENADNTADVSIQLLQLGLSTVSSLLVVTRTVVTSRVFLCENFLWRDVAIKISSIASTAFNALFGDMGGNVQSKQSVVTADPKQAEAANWQWRAEISSTSDDDDLDGLMHLPRRTAFQVHEAMAETNRKMLPLQMNVNAITQLGVPLNDHDRIARLNQLLQLAALEKSYKGLMVELRATGAWMPANLVDGSDLI